jgi:hypothetical protein
MNERPDQIIKLVENTIDDFDEQMSLLRVLVGHEQRQDVIEERACAKLSCVNCYLPQG